MKNFLVIDDHEIIRSGIKNILSEFFKSCEVYEAFDGESAVLQLKQRHFQLVIMDVQMPGTDALDMMEFIKTNSPQTAVLIFSMASENAYAKRFLKAGAMGFVSKDAGLTELKKAISLVLSNRKYLSPNLAEKLIEDLGKPAIVNPFDKLSTREFEIASLLIKGTSIKEISGIYRLDRLWKDQADYQKRRL
ncbi:MAG: response regulator transcription factor [Bacteroidota bacterium]